MSGVPVHTPVLWSVLHRYLLCLSVSRGGLSTPISSNLSSALLPHPHDRPSPSTLPPPPVRGSWSDSGRSEGRTGSGAMKTLLPSGVGHPRSLPGLPPVGASDGGRGSELGLKSYESIEEAVAHRQEPPGKGVQAHSYRVQVETPEWGFRVVGGESRVRGERDSPLWRVIVPGRGTEKGYVSCLANVGVSRTQVRVYLGTLLEERVPGVRVARDASGPG